MDKLLDLLHRYKGVAAIALVFIAGGFTATGHEKIALAITSLGTLLKVGWLPDGPSPKVDLEDSISKTIALNAGGLGAPIKGTVGLVPNAPTPIPPEVK